MRTPSTRFLLLLVFGLAMFETLPGQTLRASETAESSQNKDIDKKANLNESELMVFINWVKPSPDNKYKIAQSEIWIKGKLYSSKAEIKIVLKNAFQLATKEDKDFVVTICADGNVPYKKVQMIMVAAMDVKIKNIRFGKPPSSSKKEKPAPDKK